MQRYMIIVIAILAGLVLLAALSQWAKRRPASAKPFLILNYRYLLAGSFALMVFFTLALLLEVDAGHPTMRYIPPQISDGEITPGYFTAE